MKSKALILLSGFMFVMLAGWTSFLFAADIKLAFRFNDPEAKEMREALDVFEKNNPGIKVELQTIAWGNSRDQFLREIAVGEGPDVVHIAFVWPKDMGNAGGLRPLNDYIKNENIHGGFDTFVATELTTNEKGDIYGIPWTTDTWALVYNKDLMSQAGISKYPASWPELKNASKMIHEKTGKTGFGFPMGSAKGNTIWFLANYYWWSNGKALVKYDSNGGYKVGITENDIAESIEYFHSYVKDGHSPELMLSISTASDPAIIEALLSGEQGIAMMPPNMLRQLVEDFETRNPGKALPFVTKIFPGGSAGSKTHLGGRTLGINSHSKNPEASWKLVKFLTSEIIFEKFYTKQFPAQKVLLKNITFGPSLKGYAEQLALARSWGAYADSPAQIGSMWNQVGRIFGDAFIGTISSNEAGMDVIKMVEKELK